MEKRIASVGGLLAIGSMLVVLASVSGVAVAFQEKIEYEAEVRDGKLVLIREGTGEEITVTLEGWNGENMEEEMEKAMEEAGIIVLEGTDVGLFVEFITEAREGIPPQLPPTDYRESFEIAKEDERVQELIAGLTAGEDYNIVAEAVVTRQEETITTLLLEVRGKYYEITIDMNNGVVKSVKEGPSRIILIK